jgi:ABC-type Fe3+-hydroxamate transport system substrate-binding protein
MKRFFQLCIAVMMLGIPLHALALSVTREIPEQIRPGEPFDVTLRIVGEMPVGVGILEILPEGLAFHPPASPNDSAAGIEVDAKHGAVAITVFQSGEIHYPVIAETAQPGAILGAYVDLLVTQPEPDEMGRRFSMVSPAPPGPVSDLVGSRIGNPVPLKNRSGLPGDDGDNVLTPAETAAFVCGYLLGRGNGTLDDVCDAAYVHVIWGGRPKSITGMDKRNTVLYRPVERIITTNPDNSLCVIAMGRGNAIVATDECTIGACICPRRGNRAKHPKASPHCWQTVCDGRLDQIPQTSTRKTVNLELMAGLNPDVILETTFWSSRANDLATKVGAPVVVAGADFMMQSFWDQILVVGTLLDEEKKAAELVARCKALIQRVNERVETIPPEKRPRVYFAPRGALKGFFDPTEGRDFTRTYRVYEPLDLAGGNNVAGEITAGTEVNVSVEQIIAWNPEFILVGCSTPEDQGIDFLLNAPELSSIEAIRKKQVYHVLYPHCRGRSAPRNVVNVLLFARLLYPELFTDMDLEKEANAIYEAFLGSGDAFSEYAAYLQFPLAYFNPGR